MNKLLPNFTQIPNVMLDEWMRELTPKAFIVLCVIARQTFGWILDQETNRRKQSDNISYSQFQQRTGYKKEAIANALKELEEKLLINITDHNGKTLNKNERNGKRLFYGIVGSSEITFPKIEQDTFPKIEQVENINNIKQSISNPTNLPENRSSKIEQTKETNTKETNTNITAVISVLGGKPPEKVKTDYRNADVQEGILLLRELNGGAATKEQLNRYALNRLYRDRGGKERVLQVFRWARSQRQEDQYCPRVSNFMDLEERWSNLEDYALRLRKGGGNGTRKPKLTIISPDPDWQAT